MFALLAAFAAGAMFGAPESGLAPWPEEPRRVSIIYDDQRILAPVQIEGVGERLFIIDTAAGASLISTALKDALRLGPDDVQRRRVRGATGMIALDYVRLPGLVFAGDPLEDVWALVGDIDEFAPVGDREVAGILGVDVLSRRDVRLDLAAGVMELSAPQGASPAGRHGAPGGRGGLAFHSDAQAGFVQFTAEINGAPVAAVLDTGARSGTLNWAAAGLAGLTPGADGVIDTGGRSAGIDGVGVDLIEARLDRLCVGEACFTGAPVRIADLAVFGLVGADGGAGPSMLVGADLLELCPAEILYSRNILRLCAD